MVGMGTPEDRVYGLGSRNNVRLLQLGLKGVGSSSQVKELDGVQIFAMSYQIAKHTKPLAQSKKRRVDEKESMSTTIQKIKEQQMNLARRPTTLAPNDTNENSDENDYVEPRIP